MALPLETQTNTSTSQTVADVVMVMRADSGEQVFANARPMRANVYETADTPDQPLEDGSSVIEHIIYKPVEIDLPLMVTGDVSPLFEEIRELFRAGELLTVQTRTRTYESMIITAMPHDERPEEMDAVTIELQLKEAVFVKASYTGAVAPVTRPRTTGAGSGSGAARTTTQRRGNVPAPPAPPATEQQGSLLYRLTRPRQG